MLLFASGVAKGDFQLSDQPLLGQWMICVEIVDTVSIHLCSAIEKKSDPLLCEERFFGSKTSKIQTFDVWHMTNVVCSLCRRMRLVRTSEWRSLVS